ADPVAAALARAFVRDNLGSHPRLQDALVVTSELVTNVVRHAPATPFIRVQIERRPGPGEGRIRVTIGQEPGSLRLPVASDRRPGPEGIGRPGPEGIGRPGPGAMGRPGPGGMGLTIMEQASDAWGEIDQTSIWFELTA
ncbi:MAG TPA: ATP-binding protein, partial [Acidimicrobiia bacterium]|nr:ATP-binding protein [Acidimicrobiia bacterium]